MYQAAIDIGTTSMHLVVARTRAEDSGFDIVTSEKEMVRLGEGAQKSHELTPAAIDRSVAAIARMAKVSRSYDAQISAVATSAVRESTNGKEFVNRVAEEVGIDVEVISGPEEARLIHLGVLQALPVFSQRHLVVDIGGGSTEFIIGQGSVPVEVKSVKVGAIRLTDKFFPSGEATPKSVKKCRNHIRNLLADVFHDLGGHQPEIGIGSSGTAETIASIIAASKGDDPRNFNGYVIGRKDLKKAVEQLVATPASKRIRIAGLDERRVDIIVAGALLLEEIFTGFGLDQLTISEYALREGVLYDRIGRDVGDEHLKDLRRSNARRLALSLDSDAESAVKTTELACMLFDRTSALHKLDEHDRELLEIAGLVHNVGLVISHAGHHKHTYYIIRNTDTLTGFTDHEIELTALIARYHRRSHPAPKHVPFAQLNEKDKHRVSVLAGILRIAIGLNRRHNSLVSSMRVNHDAEHSQLKIEPVTAGSADISLEVYAASERSTLLQEALGLEIEIIDTVNQ